MNSAASPEALFIMDLEQAISDWQAKGDTVIVATDMNEDIIDTKLQDMF